jgi:hypothetical protein
MCLLLPVTDIVFEEVGSPRDNTEIKGTGNSVFHLKVPQLQRKSEARQSPCRHSFTPAG